MKAPKGSRRALHTIRGVLEAVDQLVFQAIQRAHGHPVPASEKRLSLHDRDCRAMRKGTTKRRGTQFAYTGEITEDNTGLIVDYGVHVGQPPDAGLIGPAMGRVAGRVGHIPEVVTADGTFGTASARKALTEVGVGTVAIKAQGNPPIEQLRFEATKKFKDHRRWRAGIEARISHLKRDWGWDRARMANIDGARTWLGWGVLGHNTHKLALRI